MGEYMLLMVGRYESSTDNAIRRGVCMSNSHLYSVQLFCGRLHVNVPQYIHGGIIAMLVAECHFPL